MGGKPQGIDAPMNGPYTIGLGGRILADWAIVNGGTGGSVAFYGVPELDFSKVETDAFKVKTNGFAPTPSNLEDIKTGGLDAAIGLDAGVLAFSQMDAAVRLATGQPLTAAEKNGAVPIQLLTKKDLGSDVSHGWTGYPDFPARFAKLWAAAK